MNHPNDGKTANWEKDLADPEKQHYGFLLASFESGRHRLCHLPRQPGAHDRECGRLGDVLDALDGVRDRTLA
jgi:hypothetical protein